VSTAESVAERAKLGRRSLPAPSPYARQVSRAKYRAKQAGYSGPHFTATEWHELVLACGGRCLACGSREDLTVDHIVPLALGGSNTIENVQPLCSVCNGSKGGETRDYRPGWGILKGNPAP
jgi:5-methylcytosine-specific restriction endonuclease McrA